MPKIFIGKVNKREYCSECYYDDTTVNISEERYFEVSDEDLIKYRWFVNNQRSDYLLLEYVEKDSSEFATFEQQVDRAWKKHLKTQEAYKAAEEKRRAASAANAQKRKLKQLAKLQAELGINPTETPE